MGESYLSNVLKFHPAARRFLVGQFLAGVGISAWWILRNLYLERAGVSKSTIGWTLSLAALGTLLVTVPMTFFMDRGRIRGYLVGGVAVFAAGLAATAMWPTTTALLAVASLAAGGGMSLIQVGSAPFFMRHSTPELRPYLFGLGTAIGPASGLLGSGLIFALATVWGETVGAQREILFVFVALAIAGGGVFLVLPEGPVEASARTPRRFDSRTALKLCIPEFLIGLGAGLTIPFINLYFSGRFLMGPADVSIVMSPAKILNFFAFLAAPVVASRLGGVRTVVACQLLSIPFFFIMALTMSPEFAVAAFLGRQVLMNMAQPVASNFAMEVVPAEQRVMVNGLKMLAWNGAWLASTGAGGWLIEHTKVLRDGFTVTMLVTIGLYLTGSSLYYFFWRTSPAMRPRREAATAAAGAPGACAVARSPE